LRVPALNMAYEPERPTEALVASPGRVWALFRDPAGATEITGLRLDLNLVARRLKIERDARVLISGPLLSGIANARPGEANEPGQAPLARVVPQGAIITAHGGVVLEDIQPRRDGDLPADARATMPAGRLVFNGPVVVEQENVRLVASRLVLIGVDGRVGQVLATDVRLDARRPEGRDGRARVAAEAASIDYRMERTAPGAPPQGRLRLRGAPGNPAELVYEVAGRLAPLPVVGQQIEIDLPSGAIRLE
jgi:hypothetical protein